MATLDETLKRFMEQPEEYLLCQGIVLHKILEQNLTFMDYPNYASVHADILNNQICSVEEACIEGNALKLKHFGVSTSEDLTIAKTSISAVEVLADP